MKAFPTSLRALKTLIAKAPTLDFATRHYPSRGQSAEQKIYQTGIGKLFWKRVSETNHRNCRIDPKTGTLAERESWACRLAESLGLKVPKLVLFDKLTTVQPWLDYPDAHLYASSQGRLELEASNVFDCALFDWLSGQQDRHNANYLYDFARRKIILIDSAHSFLRHDGTLPHYLEIFETAESKRLFLPLQTQISRVLQSLKPKELRKMVPLKILEEADALIDRLDRIKHATTIAEILSLYRKGKS